MKKIEKSIQIKDIVDKPELQKQETLDNGNSKGLPDNENYQKALNMYIEEKTHSAIAKELCVSILTTKRYYNWLVIHGFLTSEQEELSPREKEIVHLLYEKKMSLKEAANELDCSVSNIVYFRNNALRKRYKPEE